MNNEHDKTKEYTEDYKDTGQQLSNALHQLVNEFGGDPAKSGVQPNEDGSYEVFIDKGPTLWFQNEIELGGWVLGMNQ